MSVANADTAKSRVNRRAFTAEAEASHRKNIQPKPAAQLVQTKLKVGTPNDRFEQEADAMADRVLSMPPAPAPAPSPPAETSANSIHSSTVNRQPQSPNVQAEFESKEESSIQPKLFARGSAVPQVQAEFESNEESSIQPKLQTNPSQDRVAPQDAASASDTHTPVSASPSAADVALAEKEEDQEQERAASSPEWEQAAADPTPPNPSATVSNALVQPKASMSVMRGDESPQAPGDFESRLSQKSGGGTPLASETQSEMEGHFGTDFSGVRVHTDTAAVQMSQDIGARAFTHGSNIFFNKGEYQPGTSGGKHLLAHELTHTVQQGASPVMPKREEKNTSAETPAPEVQPKEQTEKPTKGLWKTLTSAAAKFVQRGWLGEKLNKYANDIPGWYLLTVVVGYNPLTERDVDRTATNFLGGIMGLMPFGKRLFDRLNENGKVEEAFTWLKGKQSEIGLTWSDLKEMAEDAWDEMSITNSFSTNFNILKKYFNRLYNKVKDFGSAVIDKVVELLKEAILVPLANYIKEQTSAYDLFTVILGQDPITGKEVPRNLANMVKGFLMLDEQGEAYWQKLEESGKLQELSTWLDLEVAKLELNPVTIISNWVKFFSNLNAEKLANFTQTISDIWNLISAPITSVVNFVINVTMKVLGAVKDWMIASLIGFIKEKTPAYPLLTVILGHDPIKNEAVERTPSKILEGFLVLTGNTEYLRQLQETGKMQELDAWVEQQMANLGIGLEALLQGFITMWEEFKITDLLRPDEVFMKVFNIFMDPVTRIFNFIKAVAVYVLNFIKDFLLFHLKKHAHKIPGYPLLTVLLERDPITGESVPRTAKNFIKGFLSFVPGGLEKYKQLEESGTIDRTFAWLEKEIAQLNLSWEAIKALFVEMWEGFSIDDLTNPIGAFERIMNLFADPVRRIIRFAVNVGVKVLEFIFQGFLFLAGPLGQKVFEVVKKTGQTIKQIYKDPIGFIKNVIEAIKMGIGQFVKNILKHLKTILINWLFGSMNGEIEMPAKFDLMGILSLGMQILGLTYRNFRERLVKKIGEEKVAKLEQAFEFIKLIATQGLAAAWQKILEFGTNIINSIIEGIRNMVITKIVEIGMQKLAMLLAGPYGAIVEAILTTYRVIATLIERIEQIADFVSGVVDSVKDIADGKLGNAANAIEQTLVKGFTMMVSFLAGAFGLGNIPKKIKQVIDTVRKPVNTAIDKVIDWVIKQGKALLGRGGGPDDKTDYSKATPEERKEAARSDIEKKLVKGMTLQQAKAYASQLKSKYKLSAVSFQEKNGGYQIGYTASPTIYTYIDPSGDASKNVAYNEETKTGANAGAGFTSQTASSPIPGYKQLLINAFGRSYVDSSKFQAPGTAIERAKTVKARKPLGKGSSAGRKDPAVIGNVGRLGEDEYVIQTGRYDEIAYAGGHLISYEVLKDNSNVGFNVAPQASSFNAPTYYNIFEERVAETIPEVDVEVKLSYRSDTFTVTKQDLVDRGILHNAPPGGPNQITLPKRIPYKWEAHAKTVKASEKLHSKEMTSGTSTVDQGRVTSNQNTYDNNLFVDDRGSDDDSLKYHRFKVFIASGGSTKPGSVETGGTNEIKIEANQTDATAASRPNPNYDLTHLDFRFPYPQGISGSGARVRQEQLGKEALKKVPGIGPAKADAIYEHRTNFKESTNWAELLNVSGIGDSVKEQIKNSKGPGFFSFGSKHTTWNPPR